MKSYTTLRNLYGSLSLNTSTTNLTLGDQLMGDAHRKYCQKYFFNEASYTTTTVAQQQFYNLPFDYSKLKTGTITIGSLKWTPIEIETRREWDILNTMPYYADIPNNYFIYGNQIGIFPIPSTTGNTITFNYKKRIPDLSIADYSTGTVSSTNTSSTLTGSGTAWLTTYLPSAGSVLNLNLWIRLTPPKGDNVWYQISSIESDTSLTLVGEYNGLSASGASYVIGQMPLILEDFQDILVYDALVTYFSSIVDNPNKLKEYIARRQSIIEMMDDYSGSKSVNVNLGRTIMGSNPNLYQNNIT